MSRVFNDLKLIFPSESLDAVDIADLTAVMHGNDGGHVDPFGQGRLDLSLGIRDVQVEIFGTAIHEQRARAKVADDLGGGGKSHRGDDYSLPGLEANGFEGEVQSGGAGVEGDGVFLAKISRKLRLELLGLRPRRQPTAAQSVNDFVDLVLADRGFVERNSQEK